MCDWVCSQCDKPGVLKCAKCKSVRYCSKECQQSHWLAHKKTCIPIKQQVADKTKRVVKRCGMLMLFASAICHHVKLRDNEQLVISLRKGDGKTHSRTATIAVLPRGKDSPHCPGMHAIVALLQEYKSTTTGWTGDLITIKKEISARDYQELMNISPFRFKRSMSRNGLFIAIIGVDREGLGNMKWYPRSILSAAPAAK